MRGIVAIPAGIGALATCVAGIGWVIARRLTASAEGRAYDLVIREVVRDEERGAVVLDRSPKTAAPGAYNLWLAGGGWVQLGSVVDEQPTTVTRSVLAATSESDLRADRRASWSGVYFRDPRDAGLDAEDVSVPTSAGPAPAWMIRSSKSEGDDWAIHIHGLGGRRAGTLRGVQVATRLGFTSLVPTYRNDGEGPTVGSGRSTLGATETGDVRAAAMYALDHGARRIVLFGWSMGAAIALQLTADAGLRRVIDALVLDSPVLDWAATINANCARAGWPVWFGFFARPWLQTQALAGVVGLQAAIPLDRFNWIDRADELSVPTLILHGIDDTSAPLVISSRLAKLRPDVVRLETFNADHTMNWNSDPKRWQQIVHEWLERNATGG